MAAELTPAQVAEFLRAQGLTVPEDLEAKVQNSVADEACEVISDHLLADDTKREVSTAWQEELFDMAKRFRAEFKSQEKNVGRGQAIETAMTLETPDGTLFVRVRTGK